MPWTTLWIGWAILAGTVAALAISRWIVARGQESHLHTSSAEARLASHQAEVAHDLDALDKWGKIVTVIAFLYTLLVAGLYAFSLFEQSSRRMWSE